MQERTPDDEPSSMVVLVIGCQSTSKVLKDEEGGYCLLGFVGLPIDHRYRRDRTVAPTTFNHLVGESKGIDRTIRHTKTTMSGSVIEMLFRKDERSYWEHQRCFLASRQSHPSSKSTMVAAAYSYALRSALFSPAAATCSTTTSSFQSKRPHEKV
jgi:hypothetical protein